MPSLHNETSTLWLGLFNQDFSLTAASVLLIGGAYTVLHFILSPW